MVRVDHPPTTGGKMNRFCLKNLTITDRGTNANRKTEKERGRSQAILSRLRNNEGVRKGRACWFPTNKKEKWKNDLGLPLRASPNTRGKYWEGQESRGKGVKKRGSRSRKKVPFTPKTRKNDACAAEGRMLKKKGLLGKSWNCKLVSEGGGKRDI